MESFKQNFPMMSVNAFKGVEVGAGFANLRHLEVNFMMKYYLKMTKSLVQEIMLEVLEVE